MNADACVCVYACVCVCVCVCHARDMKHTGVRTPIVGLISEKLAQLPHEGALVDRVLLPTLATMGALPLVFEASGAPSGYESYFVPWREEGGNGGGDGAAGGSTDCGVLFSGNSHPEPFACELHSYR